EAPGLIDAAVDHDIGHAEAELGGGGAGCAVEGEGVVRVDGAVDAPEGGVVGVDGAALAGGGVLERERGGEAVAELGGIGPQGLARGTIARGRPLFDSGTSSVFLSRFMYSHLAWLTSFLCL